MLAVAGGGSVTRHRIRSERTNREPDPTRLVEELV